MKNSIGPQSEEGSTMCVLLPQTSPGSYSEDPGRNGARELKGFADPSTFSSLHL